MIKKPPKKKLKSPVHELICGEIHKLIPDAEIDFTNQGETHLLATCGTRKVCFAIKGDDTIVLFRMAHPKPERIQSTYVRTDAASFDSLINKASKYLAPAPAAEVAAS